MIAAGAIFGPYRVIEKIGAGGMGDVYRALDTRLEREVALKLISGTFLAADQGSPNPYPGTPHSRVHLSHERFLREARAAATLNHPNICAIHDVGEQDGQPYLVMELLRGETLKQYLSNHKMAPAEVLSLSQQAAGALAAAHARGIVHRDIKPANLFVVDSGRERKQLKILDFGLAKKQNFEASPDSRYFAATSDGFTDTGMLDLTTPGSTVGTAAYMSPEQAKGEPLDARTDLFSLGSVLFEMAAGQPAFAGRSTAEVFAALLMKEPPPVSSLNPAMPRALDGVVAKLLVKNRSHRYETAEDLLTDLEGLTQSATTAGDTASSPASHSTNSASIAALPPAEPDRRRPRSRMIVFAVLLLVACAGLVFQLRNHVGRNASVVTSATPPAGNPASLKDNIILADFINKTGDAVFDASLDQALRVQLGQSPVLDIISQQHLRQSMQYLGRKQDETVTPQIAREIGEREGVKAILTGSIAPLGKAYILTLTAQNTASGDDIANEQATASDKEHVLEALNQVATGMRAKLGESLSSIQRLNAPFGQATTPSLEAFRAYALGDEAHQKGNDIPEAQDHYKRALELDPKLAMAWARLGVLKLNSGAVSDAETYFTRAWQLTNGVSEREKLYIDSHYYAGVVGDLNKGIETLQVATQEYPKQIDNFVNLGVLYLRSGEVQKADTATQRALAIQPDDAISLVNGINSAVLLNQPAVALSYMQQAQRLGLNGTSLLLSDLGYYSVLGDWDGAQKVLTAAAGRPDQFAVTNAWASVLPERGQFTVARTTFLHAADQAKTVKALDAEASAMLSAAGAGWMVGRCVDPAQAVKDALKLDKGKVTETTAALTLALCDEEKQATPMIDLIEKRYPQDTLVQELLVPSARGWLMLKSGDAQQALTLLERVGGHDAASFAPYMRGLAYLQLKDPHNAIAAFQAGTRFKGVAYYFGSPYALSYLGLGRAYVMAGDRANAREAYKVFLAEWKDADADLPILLEAKKEYSQL